MTEGWLEMEADCEVDFMRIGGQFVLISSSIGLCFWSWFFSSLLPLVDELCAD